jgi:glycosyltransferase involved in cell wall biosynthesis
VIFVVLPAYNEAEALPRLLRRITSTSRTHFGSGLRVILTDDGSADGTPELARQVAAAEDLCLEVVSRAVNQGLGAAIKTGLTTALARSNDHDDVIVTMDADDTHLPGLIPRMVQMIEEGNDLVIASRFQPGALMLGIPRYRQLLSTGLSWLFRAVYPVPGARETTRVRLRLHGGYPDQAPLGGRDSERSADDPALRPQAGRDQDASQEDHRSDFSYPGSLATGHSGLGVAGLIVAWHDRS